jgi:AbrB family looped-hinge helix DNA binding protein
MLSPEVKLSRKNQMVVPRQAREALNLKAGDKLLVVVRGGAVILLRKPKRHARAVLGMARNLYRARVGEPSPRR